MKNALIALLLTLAATSCTTFQKAFRKYGHMANDTTLVEIPVTVTVPRDSVVMVLKTDTTHIIQEMRQGRATVKIIRDHTNTIVQADCDSVIKTVTGKTKVVTRTVNWGVDPKYESQAKNWKTGAVALAAFNLVVLGLLLLSRKFTFTVAKKA
jgi:hypothetical protein